MKKAVIYARYSSHNQTEQSIEGQTHVCEKFAKDNGYKIVGSYVDRAISGTSDKRPEFQHMIDDSQNGKFDIVLVYKLDRFARNRFDSALYKKKLRDNGIRVVSATENITDTPEGIIMEGLLESMDEYYSAELSRKCKRGFEESFKKGRFLGKSAPFGYKVVDHKLQIDEDTAPVAKEVFTRFVNGAKYAEIIKDLNQRQIYKSNGKKWNKTNIFYMLENRIYTGEYSVSDMGVMECPALISKDLFEKTQKIRQERIHSQRQRRTDYTYYLTGKLINAENGAKMHGSSMNHGKYHYYMCDYPMAHNYINADNLHESVKEVLKTYLTADKIEELALAAFQEYNSGNQSQNEYEALKKQLKCVEKKLDNAVDAILNGVDANRLKEKMKELEQQKYDIEEKLDRVESAPPKLTFEHFLYAMTDIVNKADENDFKKLIDAIVNQVIIKDNTAIVCINLTDNNATPPLEQILFKVKEISTYCPTWI